MNANRIKSRKVLSWISAAGLFLLCAVLGILQYQWIGEVSVAERERLQGNLKASLTRFSQDFNSDITAACVDLLPFASIQDQRTAEKDLAARYAALRAGPHGQIFHRIAILTP